MFICGGSHGFHHSWGGCLSLVGSLDTIPVDSSTDSWPFGESIPLPGSSVSGISRDDSVFGEECFPVACCSFLLLPPPVGVLILVRAFGLDGLTYT